LRRGQRVIDLGCWPGGWLQVAAAAIGPRGRVVGVDLRAIDPPLESENVIAIEGDLEDPDVVEQILAPLGGLASLLLSDAAPNITGVRDVDRAAEERLLESVEALVPQLLQPGGDLLLKILECPEAAAIDRRIRGLFGRAKTVRPSASRKGSSERYLLARGYQPPGAGQ
jgi:23S rRNA (uridine2552-2'-O)-methyltransferase